MGFLAERRRENEATRGEVSERRPYVGLSRELLLSLHGVEFHLQFIQFRLQGCEDGAQSKCEFGNSELVETWPHGRGQRAALIEDGHFVMELAGQPESLLHARCEVSCALPVLGGPRLDDRPRCLKPLLSFSHPVGPNSCMLSTCCDRT